MPEWAPPTRLASAVFQAKVQAHRLRRAALDAISPAPRLARAPAAGFEAVAGESVTPLWSDLALAEHAFQLGRVANLRRAARALDGRLIPAGQVFSFWRQVGAPSPWRGFVTGRMLQQGCMTPATGGGLCQLSNALYDVALKAGCEIVERHPHSRIVPGSAAAYGRDATVAWNYVDLRFRAERPLRLTVRLDRDQLVVRLMGETAEAEAEFVAADGAAVEARSCGTCDEVDCFRHEPRDPEARRPGAVTAFLVDEAWPEIQAYVSGARGEGDRLALPLDGARFGLARYRWRTDGFAQVASAPLAALGRAWAIRRAPAQGPARRLAEIEGARRLAAALARRLDPEATHLVVAQSLLPHLWREGHLGGRTFDVLLTRLPMQTLQARLDAAHALHPERPTLSDFRAPADLVRDEAEALAEARRIVTPHAEAAALFGERAERLGWIAPDMAARPPAPTRRIAFPGPTVARKGAYAVREAARALDLEVVLLGAELEGDGFWDGVRTLRPTGDWLEGVCAVVQPAIAEDQPRRLIAAQAAGVPVIASAACGLDRVIEVAADDGPSLAEALKLQLPEASIRR